MLGAVRRTSGGVRGLLGAGKDCRYSGDRMCIGGIRVIGRFLGDVEGVGAIFGGVRGHQGCRGCWGVLGGWQGL